MNPKLVQKHTEPGLAVHAHFKTMLA